MDSEMDSGMDSGGSAGAINYISLQGFFHTVLRNIGVCITVSLATMTLNRYWRSLNSAISVFTWMIAALFMLLSIYINVVLLTELEIHERRLETETDRGLFKRWKYITWFLAVCQAIFLISYCVIAKVIYSESHRGHKRRGGLVNGA